MKKFLSLLLCVLLFAAGVFAEEAENTENGRVEIEFCVGDATLLINGEEVTVEKPYVVGEGVTLVPVRVITEAFGATVGWVKETKTITLEYPDVNIVLQIGNPIAEINGRAETLLAAPELSAGGFTMVPLRFISENFGAEVGYDNGTKRITVVKEAIEEGATVEGAIENTYIGDSYYGWMMENPKDMYLDDRDFDGEDTYFLDEDDCWIDIGVYPVDEEYDFEDDYTSWKGSFGDYTLLRADKDTSDSNRKTMHFQAKNKTIFRDVYVIVTDKYVYLADGGFDMEGCGKKDEYSRIISTFDVKFEGEDIYDLSNVKDGMRTYENEDLKFSLDVPENLFFSSSENALNNFSFSSSDDEDFLSRITVCVYSKESIGGAEEVAKREFEKVEKYYSDKYCSFSEVVEKEYEAVSGYEYAIDMKTDEFTAHTRDYYFEIGEYTYNITFILMDNDDAENVADKVYNSFKAEELDFDEVGMIMYPIEERKGTKTVDKISKCSFEIPYSFQEVALTETAAIYTTESKIGTITVVTDSSKKYTRNDLDVFAESFEFQVSNKEGTEIVQSVKSRTIGGKTFRHFSYTMTDDKFTSVCNDYIIVKNGMLYIIETAVMDIGDSEYTKNQLNEIIKSFDFE